jgi:hypothetical protein
MPEANSTVLVIGDDPNLRASVAPLALARTVNHGALQTDLIHPGCFMTDKMRRLTKNYFARIDVNPSVVPQSKRTDDRSDNLTTPAAVLLARVASCAARTPWRASSRP